MASGGGGGKSRSLPFQKGFPCALGLGTWDANCRAPLPARPGPRCTRGFLEVSSQGTTLRPHIGPTGGPPATPGASSGDQRAGLGGILKTWVHHCCVCRLSWAGAFQTCQSPSGVVGVGFLCFLTCGTGPAFSSHWQYQDPRASQWQLREDLKGKIWRARPEAVGQAARPL